MTQDVPDDGPTRDRSIWETLRRGVNKAGEYTSSAARKGAEAGGELIHSASQTTQDSIGRIRRSLGEDYYAILDENPLVRETLSRSTLLERNDELLATALNIPWTSSLLWSAAAGAAFVEQPRVAHVLASWIHECGHIDRWKEINEWMDLAVGKHHRLKFGHSLDFLPQIVEKFGWEGIPAYFAHIMQDMSTIAGVPIIPHAWDVRQALVAADIPRKVATGLVSLSYSSTLGALGVISFVAGLSELGKSLVRKRRSKAFLSTAADALRNRDYNATVTNYQRSLEIERNPYVLMALGQVYMQRAPTRLRAHNTFVEALTLLGETPEATVSYAHSRLSVRGLAGLQALATADVLADIHPEYWNDHIQELVNASVFSFSSSATRLAESNSLTGALGTQAQFSAAINYFLAAKASCLYPFADDRREIVLRNTQCAMRSLGLMAQYDEDKLRPPAVVIRELWARELLPEAEREGALASY
jgi:hypothetical protein